VPAGGWLTPGSLLPEFYRPRKADRLVLPQLREHRLQHELIGRDDGDGLERLAKELDTATPRVLKSRRDFEDVALTTAAGAVVAAALARTETRGCHHRSDYPAPDPALAHSLLPAVVC